MPMYAVKKLLTDHSDGKNTVKPLMSIRNMEPAMPMYAPHGCRRLSYGFSMPWAWTARQKRKYTTQQQAHEMKPDVLVKLTSQLNTTELELPTERYARPAKSEEAPTA